MHHSELVSYIVNQLRSCVAETDIIATLQKNGWTTGNIETSLKTAKEIVNSQGQNNLCAVRIDFTGTSQHAIAPKHTKKLFYLLSSIVLCTLLLITALVLF